MNWTLPNSYVINKGDFAKAFSGYFYLTNTQPSRPVVGSEIMSQLEYLAHNITVWRGDDITNYAKNVVHSYGIDSFSDFMRYLDHNSNTINRALQGYYAVSDLEDQIALKNKLESSPSLGELIGMGARNILSGAGEAASGAAAGIGDDLKDFFKSIGKPIITIIVVAIVIFIVIGIVKNKYYKK